jgi:arylsulfatase A-like enzyme
MQYDREAMAPSRKCVAALAKLVALAVLALACAPGAQVMKPKRIVLVTLDTTRADHLSAYGYDLQTSPWFDRMAAEGVLFEHAYAQSATTKPSHSSLFTSLYPIQHGVQSNALVLEEQFVTWAEVLADAGYQTAAFTSVGVPLGGNVGQGFQKWDDPGEEYSHAESGEPVYRPARVTVDAAIDWLGRESDPELPMFLWVHVYDAHKPLRAPERYQRRIEEMVAVEGVDAHEAHLRSQGILVGKGRYYERGLVYDAEILYADTELQRLFDFMATEGRRDETVWIITADHGQGLGSHDHFGHSVQVYNAQLHVPLVFWSSVGAFGQRRVDDVIVELTDILPTLLDILGLARLQQVMPVQGETLWTYLQGRAPRQRRLFAYSERSRYPATPKRLEKSNYEAGSRYSYQDLAYKYLLFTEGPDEFYDLSADPYELVNLIESEDYAEIRDLFRDRLVDLVANTESGATPGSVSQEAMEQLRALGYVQ